MQVACCQLDIRWEDKPANYRRVEELVRGAGLAPGALLVLPEMFATGFTMNATAVVERTDGPTCAFLGRLAAAHRAHVLGGVVLADGAGRPRNEAALFGPEGQLVGRYAKMHPFTLGGERDSYAAGDAVVTLPLPGGLTLQPAVCYDLRFPELFRRVGPRAPEVIAVMANWPVARVAHWVALAQARAIENQAYVIAVNRCGADPKLTYNGHSRIIDPRGEVLADAGEAEGVIRAEVDRDMLEAYRGSLPFLRDKRGDLVG